MIPGPQEVGRDQFHHLTTHGHSSGVRLIPKKYQNRERKPHFAEIATPLINGTQQPIISMTTIAAIILIIFVE